MKFRRLPVTMEGCEGGCSRRELLEVLGVGMAGVVLLGACGEPGSSLPSATTTMCGANVCLDLADASNSELLAVDGALLIDTAKDTIMVIRKSETAVIALSAICTHAGCSMDFVPATQQLDCPCHGSKFGEDGKVIKGPARRALRVYVASLSNNVITITL